MNRFARFFFRRFLRRSYIEAISRHRAARYDAFISYGNVEPDCALALELFEQLDQYRAPREVIDEEHPAGLSSIYFASEYGAAGEEIEEMLRCELRKSEFLIVLCSPQSRDRPWVRFEVETFAELKGGWDRILPVLVDGEPADAMPEPLPPDKIAADLRAKSEHRAVARVKTEKLRLLAPILGCEYAELRQRHVERLLRRTLRFAIAIVMVLFVVASLAGIAVVQWRSATSRLNQALSIFESVDQVLAQRTGGRFGEMGRDELFEMIPGDREASLFCVIFSDLAFVSLAESGIQEARVYFDQADEIVASAALNRNERAKIMAGFAYGYGHYAEECLRLHVEKVTLSHDASLGQLAADPEILIALTTDKDYLKEAEVGFGLAIARIEAVINIDDSNDDYKEFRDIAQKGVARTLAQPFLEELGDLQDSALEEARQGRYRAAANIYEDILDRQRALPDEPEYVVQRCWVMCALGNMHAAMGDASEARRLWREALLLIDESGIGDQAVDVKAAIEKSVRILRSHEAPSDERE